MLKKCHIQRKIVCTLLIMHIHSQLAPLVRKNQKFANPPSPLVRKNQKLADSPHPPPLVADIICERPLMTWLGECKDFLIQIFAYYDSLLPIGSDEITNRLQMWLNNP